MTNEEIQVGEYIRTKDGYIGKVVKKCKEYKKLMRRLKKDDTVEWVLAYLNGKMLAKEALMYSGVCKCTFWRRIKEIREIKNGVE